MFCLRHDARQVDRSNCGVEVKMQRLFVAGLAIRKTGELFGVAEDELDLKPRFVKTKDVTGGNLGVGREQHDKAWSRFLFAVDHDRHSDASLQAH